MYLNQGFLSNGMSSKLPMIGLGSGPGGYGAVGCLVYWNIAYETRQTSDGMTSVDKSCISCIDAAEMEEDLSGTEGDYH
jgi:hypothetical protein